MVETVINVNDGFVQIIAVGGEIDLDFDFPIYEKAHIRIIRTRSGTTADLVLDTDYTIANDQLEVTAGGTAVLAGASTPAVAGDVYTLLLDVPEARTTDFTQVGPFLKETLNEELDLYAQMAQGLRRDVNKSISMEATSALTGVTAPDPESGKVLVGNSTNDGYVNSVPADLDLAVVSAFVETLLDDTTAAAFMTTLGITAFAQTILDDANATTALTTLGFSTFGKTLIDDADAAAVLTTLGISAFVQTLLDDTTGGAFLTTLGVTAAAQTVLDDATVAAMVDTLGGASSTGSGGLVRTTSPVLVTPTLGAALATSINFGQTTLSTYEVGTYTVALTAGTSGTITIDGSADTGAYERIGNLVHVHGAVSVGSVSSPMGNLRISLPFTVGDLTELSDNSPGSVWLNSTVSAGAAAVPSAAISGVSYLEVYLNGTTAIGQTAAAQMQAGSSIRFSVKFRI